MTIRPNDQNRLDFIREFRVSVGWIELARAWEVKSQDGSTVIHKSLRRAIDDMMKFTAKRSK